MRRERMGWCRLIRWSRGRESAGESGVRKAREIRTHSEDGMSAAPRTQASHEGSGTPRTWKLSRLVEARGSRYCCIAAGSELAGTKTQ
jgi:hypothetical protein